MSVYDDLGRFKNVRRCGAGWTAQCPAHNDSHNSLSIGEGESGRLLLYCHAGCTFEAICAAAGISSREHIRLSARGVVAFYDYQDEQGDLLYQAVRYEPKGFSQRRPDGSGGWVNRLNGVRRVLYRLPYLLGAGQEQLVFVVEGEKDAERLASLGFISTTNAGGAGKWRDEYSECLRDRHVVIIPDNDEAGREHAAKVARSLHRIAASTRVLTLPGLPPKGDVSDWLDSGGVVDELLVLAEQAPLWKPGIVSKQGQRFTLTPLDDLLGEPEEQTAYVWDRTLPRGGFSICSAKPKVGKSTLARNLALAVSRGEEFFGRETVRGKIIYLCLEEKRAEVARHFRRMGAGGSDINIHTGGTPEDAVGALAAAIEEHSPALLIIDPLSRFVRVTDFNSYGEVTRALEPLIDLARSSECQCHIMAVHHNGKGEREGGDALLGSTGFFGAVDALLTMKRRERVRTLETVQRYGEDLPETVVHLDPETGIVTPQGDMQTLLLDERKSAVLDNLSDEPLAEGDIKERISGNQGLTSKAVRALYEEGRLIRTGAGKKGDPYRYQSAGEPVKNASENHGFSRSANIGNLENLQYPDPDSIHSTTASPELGRTRAAAFGGNDAGS